MRAWLESLSIRRRIVLFAIALLLPPAVMLTWFVAAELRQARTAANEKVRILAIDAATNLQNRFAQAETILAQFAPRPLVKALDPAHCDPIAAEFALLNREYLTLDVRDAHGTLVCSVMPNRPRSLTAAEKTWFESAWATGRFMASGVVTAPDTGRKLIALSHPVRNDAGKQLGIAVLSIDLLTLNQQLLSLTPKDAIVTVADASRAVVLRSTDPEEFIGTRPPAGEADPAKGAREGYLSARGRDGVPRLFAFLTLPGVDWRVSANMPEARVFEDYRSTLRVTVVVAVMLLLLALLLAWRVSAAIVRPITRLADAATAVARGDCALHIVADGPAEVAALATEFNRMLESRSASDAARREADARYRMLVEWSPEAISVHVDGVVRFVNKACITLLRAASAEDLVGRASLSVIGPAEQPGVLQRVSEALERGVPIPPAEQVFTRSDGTCVTVEVSGVPMLYDGRPALLASMRDVSERKHTEAALARSEAQLRAIVGTATVAIIVADAAQTIVSANPAAGAMFGHEAAELIGSPLERLIPKRYREGHRQHMREFGSSSDRSRHMGHNGALRDIMGLRADGEEFPVEAAISHFSVAGESLETVILHDISERRRAESALRESEGNLRRLLVLLPEAVFVTSGQRVSFVNEAAKRLFLADEAALLGRDPLTLLHSDSHELVRSRMEALRTEATAVPLAQVKIVRGDGAVRLVESVAARVDDHGEGAFIVVMRDVSTLIETQAALAESHAELQRLIASQEQIQEEERKRIARELHDDLQQTLAAIRIDLVAATQRIDTAPQEVAPLLQQTGGLAASALESTRRIINDLRPQMLEDLGLIPALEALASQFSRRTRIDCRVSGTDESAFVMSLPSAVTTCLYRVAQEALGNVARHANATRARMRIEHTEDDQVVLRIDDNGQGMVVGAPRKPTSFGLLGMNERVRALGGGLQIDSEVGGGTTIMVSIPLRTNAAHALDPLATNPVARPLSNALNTSHLLPAVIDALDGNIAVLNRHGVIVLVNQAWREFAARGGDAAMRSCGPGTSYLDVCRRSAPDEPLAERALQGLSAVLSGHEASYELEYPCATPDGLRWFRLHAAPIDEQCIVVTHVVLASRDTVAPKVAGH